jgi:hypothetical protein
MEYNAFLTSTACNIEIEVFFLDNIAEFWLKHCGSGRPRFLWLRCNCNNESTNDMFLVADVALNRILRYLPKKPPNNETDDLAGCDLVIAEFR